MMWYYIHRPLILADFDGKLVGIIGSRVGGGGWRTERAGAVQGKSFEK